MADYVKTNEGDLLIQLNDHAAGVAIHGATVGLSAPELPKPPPMPPLPHTP